VQKKGKKRRFRRIFVALKPCVDGFLVGCRPFIGVDASSLTGKYTGQLASATGVDGQTGCTTLPMQFLTRKMRAIGSG
jgi:hypothetical protein